MVSKIKIAEDIVEMLMSSEYIPKKSYAEYSDLILDTQDVLSDYINDKEIEEEQ